MIRPTTPDDTTALIALAKATGLFEPSQLNEIDEMLAEYFSNSNSENLWFTDDDDEPVGIAYCEPERMTHQTLPLSEYILRILSIRQVLSNPPKTGAELVAYWQSEAVINSRPEIADSQAHARNLRS